TTSIMSGRRISHHGRYKRNPITGMIVAGIGLFLFSTMNADTSLVTASIYMVVFGSGLGLVMQGLVIAVQNGVSLRDLRAATSANTFVRSLGGACRTALFGADMRDRLSAEIGGLLPGVENTVPADDLTGSPALNAQIPDHMRGPPIEAFSKAI